MASLYNDNGRYVVQIKSMRGSGRPTISLGHVTERQARSILSHVEHLVNAAMSSTPAPRETAIWLGEIGDDLHARLVKVKITKPRTDSVVTELGPFFDQYIAKRTDLKPRSIDNLKQVRKFAVEHFGVWIDIATINRGNVKDWHRTLLESYAGPTVAMHVKKMRQLFAEAIDHTLIKDNPFLAVKAGSMSNTARMFYVPREWIEMVIEKCPSEEWKMLFALARYAGLRVPSETRSLKWSDFDWANNRFTVRASKTEHHEGKGTRIVPIFPELLPHVRRAHASAGDAVHVLVKQRGDNVSTTAKKIIKRAGVVGWQKTFQNLRSSCETDLATRFPLHVACAWIGNSTGVALKSYLQVHNAFFDAASKGVAPDVAASAGEPRRITEQTGHNTPENKGEMDNQTTPKGDATPLLVSTEKQQKAHEALQRTLHPVQRRAELGGRQPDVPRAFGRISRAIGGAV